MKVISFKFYSHGFVSKKPFRLFEDEKCANRDLKLLNYLNEIKNLLFFHCISFIVLHYLLAIKDFAQKQKDISEIWLVY